MPQKSTLAYSIALSFGTGLWFMASMLSGKREPWDDLAYWTLAYPSAIALSGILGFVFTDRPWRWALALFLGQFAGMCLRNGELGNLWPLGLTGMAILSVPGIALALFAAWLRGRQAND